MTTIMPATARTILRMPRWSLERALIVLTVVLALVVPLVSWTDTAGPVRVMASVLFALFAGVPAAILLFPVRRSLWLAVGPSLSLALLFLGGTLLLVIDVWNPSILAGLLALVAVVPAPFAWARAVPLPVTSDTMPRRRRVIWSLLWLAPVAALGLWIWAIAVVDLDAVGALGLVAVLPWQYAAALIVICAGIAFVLADRTTPIRHLFLVVSSGLLVLFLATFVSFADGGAVAGTGYVHVGFADVIARTGQVLESTDARFSWPGFFAAAAAVAAWAGLPDSAPFLVAYPAVIGALMIAPLFVLGRAITGSARIAWLGVVLYACGNWVQQDYFSPQSVAFLLYTTIIAVLFWQTSLAVVPRATRSLWTRLRILVTRTPSRAAPLGRRRALAIEAMLLVLAAGMVVGHQLTPVTLVGLLAALSLVGVIRSRTLWIAVGVLFAAWFAFGAVDWWQGNLSILIDGFGQADEAISSGVTDRVRGDALYQRMQLLRIAWSAAFAVAGAVGWVLSRRRFPLTGSAVLVAVPAALVFAQPYGGEVVLRVFLYALPALAVLSALTLARLGTAISGVRRPDLGRWHAPVLSAGLTVLLFVAAMLGTTTRGVNTAFERNPGDVVDLAQEILDDATTGAAIAPLETEGPLRAARVGEVGPAWLSGEGSTAQQLLAADPDYILFTQTRAAYETLINGQDPEWFGSLVLYLRASGRYEVMRETDHAVALQRVPGVVLPTADDADDSEAGR